MSNFPMPNPIPSSPLQVAGVLQSALHTSQELLQSSPANLEPLRSTFLQFYASPTFQLILGIPTQHHTTTPSDNQLQAKLSSIKSTITTLSKAVSDLAPKVKGAQAPPSHAPPHKGKPSAQGKGHAHAPTPSFTSKVTSKAWPSLVLDLGASNPTRHNSMEITSCLDDKLHMSGHQYIKLSAAKWTSKGNLVLTAHHTIMQDQLTAATSTITSLF